MEIDPVPESSPSAHAQNLDPCRGVLFKNNCIYKHKLLRINYTTYDVRRAQDVVNPSTPHCDIMLLADQAANDRVSEEMAPPHQFLYARVLGIYHANIIYVGSGMVDYTPQRFKFLWVRWFEVLNHRGKDSDCLDQVSFLPLNHEDAFGFVDPVDVLRGCHIIPRFAGNKRYSAQSDVGDDTQVGLSPCAQDRQDWNSYYVNR